MKIELNSGWMKAVIGKAIKFGISKTGYNADLKIYDITIADSDNGIRLHLDFDAMMDRKEIERIIKTII